MQKHLLLFLVIISFSALYAQSKVTYIINHQSGSSTITVEIVFDSIRASDLTLIIPRSAPGTYEITNYLAFVDHVEGVTLSDNVLMGVVGEGSFFVFNDSDEYIKKVRYVVDIQKMETELLGAYASSKTRNHYLGLLGYSVLGFIEGQEQNPITLEINTAPNWPIFSTLRPSSTRKQGRDNYQVDNFAILADAQYLLGNAVQVFEVEEAPIPFFVAAYSETPIDMEEIGRKGLVSLNGLVDYFGYIPMPHYTVFYEFLTPVSERHDYGFSMEHLNSMSSSNDTSRAVTTYDPNARLGSIIHHIGHSWLPLRSYGTGYRPFEWQTAPQIETIWLNEGFIWYISYYQILENQQIIYWFENNLRTAPDFIKSKSLRELSMLGSTQYGLDFRIGKNLFSRGALLAYELDILIKKETSGEQSFKDAILGLLNWTEVNKRAFEYDEIEKIMSEATGVDLKEVWNKWQGPIKE